MRYLFDLQGIVADRQEQAARAIAAVEEEDDEHLPH